MKRIRITAAAAAAGVAAAALLFGGAFRGESSDAGVHAVSSASSESFQAGFALGNTAFLVQQLQAELRLRASAAGYATLGLAYQQRARETGDPTYYTKSDGVLRRALALESKNATAVSGLGSLALSRHRFRTALALGRKALVLQPDSVRNYGIVGDALVELGRYRAAFGTFDTMARTKPGLSAYARVSYGRELLGNLPGAIRAMRLAVDAATSEPEATAWSRVQLGKLYWATGNVAAAERQYRLALAVFPGYVYALDPLAQVEASRGRIRAAVRLEQEAVDRIPLPQFVAALGDLYRITGRARLARREYALIGVIQRLLVSNGVKTDLETALFDVDHGIGLRHALALARAAHRDRPSIDADDVLAWALARNGRCGEALIYSRRALRLGTRDALKFFHRGQIERCLGHAAAARAWLERAVSLNPHFSIVWGPVARRELR